MKVRLTTLAPATQRIKSSGAGRSAFYISSPGNSFIVDRSCRLGVARKDHREYSTNPIVVPMTW
jgi:hypothetical protein